MKKIMMAMMMAMMTTTGTFAQEAEQTQAQTPEASGVYTIEIVSGEVSAIGKRFISIVTDRDYDIGAEYETMIPITNNTVFNHVNGLSGIKKGDLVSIEYRKPVAGSKGMAYAETVNFIQSALAGSGLVSTGTDNSAASDSTAP